jgi:hypothetical protein
LNICMVQRLMAGDSCLGWLATPAPQNLTACAGY